MPEEQNDPRILHQDHLISHPVFIMPGGTGKNVLIQVEKNDDVLFMDVTDFALHETYNSEKE